MTEVTYEDCREAILQSHSSEEIGQLTQSYYEGTLATAESLHAMDEEIDDLIQARGEAKKNINVMESVNPIRSVAGDRLITLATGTLFQEKMK